MININSFLHKFVEREYLHIAGKFFRAIFLALLFGLSVFLLFYRAGFLFKNFGFFESLVMLAINFAVAALCIYFLANTEKDKDYSMWGALCYATAVFIAAYYILQFFDFDLIEYISNQEPEFYQ